MFEILNNLFKNFEIALISNENIILRFQLSNTFYL